MIFVFRVDASQQIGTGHLMRCLTLADALRSRGFQTLFISRSGNISEQVLDKGHAFKLLEAETPARNVDPEVSHAHWLAVSWEEDAMQTSDVLRNLEDVRLIIDHYAIDYKWESALHDFCQQIVVLDDLADRKHQCNLLVDTNYRRRSSDYSSLVDDKCTLCTGTDFVLLRPEFLVLREQAETRRESIRKIKRILVFLSGTDPEGYTDKVLSGLASVSWTMDTVVDIVLGRTFEHKQAIHDLVRELPFEANIFVDTQEMAQLIYDADLAIGSAGSATWERCCLGLPTISLTIADNQVYANQMLGKDGVVISLEKSGSQLDNLVSELQAINQQTERLKMLSNKSFSIIDGEGTERVVEAILGLSD